MKTVYLLIGLPGSGKSTFAKQNLKSAQIVELDEVRQTLADKKVIGRKYSSDDNKLVFEHFYAQVASALNTADKVVVDCTNARLSERNELYSTFAAFKPKYIAIQFKDDKQTVIGRVIKRQQENPNCVHVFSNPSEAIDIYQSRLDENPVSFAEPIAELWTVKNGQVVSKDKKILIASTNAGKIAIYKEILDSANIPCTSLAEIKVTEKVDENGKDELENAIIKAKAYHKITGLPVIANDSGLIIDKFLPENQPGVLVRRVNGKERTDQEMLDIYITKLNEVGGESDGHYNVALASIDQNGTLRTGLFKPHRHFISTPSKILLKGIPLSSLAYDEATNRYLSEMTPAEQNAYEAEAMEQQKRFILDSFTSKNK